MDKIEQLLTDFKNSKLSKNACQLMIYKHFISNEYIFDKNICEFEDYCKHYVCPKNCKLSFMNDVIYNNRQNSHHNITHNEEKTETNIILPKIKIMA